jgi:hypothetical protein
MALRFSTLASGSKGNSSIVELDGKYLMVDIGLSAKSLKGRLSQIGLSIQSTFISCNPQEFNDIGTLPDCA